jgi:two-component system, probable response regulator PhcQ
MPPEYDYQRFAILYVDDEEKSLKSFERAFEDTFRIFTANSAAEGLKLLEQHRADIGVLMTDQRMPNENGVWLLERARQLEPRMIRILASAYSDIDAAINAVNSGAIYKYLVKPWDPTQLETTLKRALEFFIVQRERDELLREKLAALHNVMVGDRIISLGLMAAGMSHHIRNSLVAVKTFLDLAPAKLREEKVQAEDLRNPEFWQDYHRSVLGQIDRINRLLKELWTVSEQAPAAFADRVNLGEAIQTALQRVDASLRVKQIEVTMDIPAVLPALLADGAKFVRMFELLFKDEQVSLPAGSRIEISAQLVPSTDGRPPLVEVRISDNGPGLPKEALRTLFDPFVARADSPSEYGINLMACYFIAHHHGGRVEAAPREPHGTVFTFTLPVNANAPGQLDEQRDLIQTALVNEEVWQRLLRAD